jgi:hypothetical protein
MLFGQVYQTGNDDTIIFFITIREQFGLESLHDSVFVRLRPYDLRLKRILGLVMPENIASVRVLEKTGLRYAETVTFWGNQFSKYIITR